MSFDDENPTDNGLVDRIQDQVCRGIKKLVPGSPASRDWAQFCRVYTVMIEGMASRCGLGRDETAELVNEVWVHVMKYLPSYQPAGHPGSFRAWLYSIVSRRAVDLFRRKNCRPAESLTLHIEHGMDLFATAMDPADAYENCCMIELIRSLLDILRVTDPDTRLLEMRIIEGQSIEAIAAAVGLPRRHVSTRIHRVLERLRKAVRYYTGERTPE